MTKKLTKEQVFEQLVDNTYENMNWTPFAEVVEDLTNDANEWLAEIEEEEED